MREPEEAEDNKAAVELKVSAPEAHRLKCSSASVMRVRRNRLAEVSRGTERRTDRREATTDDEEERHKRTPERFF